MLKGPWGRGTPVGQKLVKIEEVGRADESGAWLSREEVKARKKVPLGTSL